jgi:hypothetical protein
MLWIAIVVTAAQLRMTPTFDEQNHVTRGIAILKTDDYRLCFHHPPLANILEGLPVAWGPSGFSTALPAWAQAANPAEIWPMAHTTIWQQPAQGLRIIQRARIPVLLFTLALALVVFLWSRELFGPWGGVFSLLLFALDPNILAHSGLATTDMAAACTIPLAVYWLRRYLSRPSRAWLLIAGAGFGLAFAAKFSALILFPILAVILLLCLFPLPWIAGSLPAQWAHLAWGTRFGRAVKLGLLLLLLGGVTVWAVYSFQVERLGSKAGQPFAASASLLQHLPIPALQYFRGLKAVKSEADGHVAYLLGSVDRTGKGWWYYFPVAMAVKTPLPELVLILGILLLLAMPRTRALLAVPRAELLFLLAPVGLYLLAASGLLGLSLNMGIRHILPIYPFLLILCGGWVRVKAPPRVLLPALGVLLAAQCASILAAYPNFLGYFNEVSIAHQDGYQILVDSNIDWGQDLGQLAALQRTEKLYPLWLSYFGTTPPEAYGLQYHPLRGFGLMRYSPLPDHTVHGYVAISVTDLMAGEGYFGVNYRPLARMLPEDRVGKSILVYYLP